MSEPRPLWGKVAQRLNACAQEQRAIEIEGRLPRLNAGQQASLRALAERLPKNGVLIADEVGMGKTRIAVEVIRAVTESGGRVAVLVPPGLGYQWQDELRDANVESPPILRSLLSYLAAWKAEKPEQQEPWFDQSVLLISHAFTNWRLGATSHAWRWALLPELYGLWRKETSSRVPRDFWNNKKLDDEWVKAAATSIMKHLKGDGAAEWHRLEELGQKTPWPEALDANLYGKNQNLRPWLERAVGLGLGVFDLVVVDEAHKSRGVDAGLSRLLNAVVLRSQRTRTLAMTATPVELNVDQWSGTLERIGVNLSLIPGGTGAVKAYSEAVEKVRQIPSNEGARNAYEEAARCFQQLLSPYLLRRDKREDKAVIAFKDYSGLSPHAYRSEEEITVETAQLPQPWKNVVCISEALSVIGKQEAGSMAKRLRLTIGNGHGIAALLATPEPTPDVLGNVEPEAQAPTEAVLRDDKRDQRLKWWLEALSQSFPPGFSTLYDHPAISACVRSVEETTAANGKVLVFGKFVQPLRALVELLNAREMIRCLQQGRPWPQSKVHETRQDGDDSSERGAVEAASRQLGYLATAAEIDDRLEGQYRELENRREQWRTKLLEKLEDGIPKSADDSRVRNLFNAFKSSVERQSAVTGDRGPLAVAGKAMYELMADKKSPEPQDFADAFTQLVNALSDKDDQSDTNNDGVLDEKEAAALWPTLEARLNYEYNRPQGGFARLMVGATPPATRRVLQLAFNRAASFPKVLVAQSMVGREGLNLHRACSTVVLLHPEWNPGVVEQQIGRVDRVGSDWSAKLYEAINQHCTPGSLPRIKVQPVIFNGTYDQHNWRVLRERWDDLRAQLNGVVISPRLVGNDVQLQAIAEELEKLAPNFSPSQTISP